jgi:coenzyme F420-0:L-glutamate ligase/coenzyme F420-1:gamma-L-glutamate ligase
MGTTGVAIGSAGIETIRDLRGDKDMFGRELLVSETANADSLASAACLLMGEGDDATPVVLIRGYETVISDQDASQLLRPKDDDMFR